jgi:hypothetical protein
MLLGFLNLLGPIAVMSAMAMASLTAHAGKPILATAGGGEFPITKFVIANPVGESNACSVPISYSVHKAAVCSLPSVLLPFCSHNIPKHPVMG